MHDMMKLRVASSGQSLSDNLTERGFKGTFAEQLEKIGAIEVKEEDTYHVTRKQSPTKEREARIQGRPRSMPRLYHKEDALAGIPWADRVTLHLQNALALHGSTMPL
jgi:hypothetical protein